MTAAAAEPASLAVRFEAPGADGIGTLTIDRPDDAVNALNPELIEALSTVVRAVRAHAGLRGLVVTSAKHDQWVAGADLRMVAQATTAKQVEQASRRFQAVCDELAWLPCTTVAVINGAALGGGLELALACDYRVGADVPAVSLGQPEVNLGLVPAGGGTQRLPRLIGLQSALDLILSGRRLNARRARGAGLLDEVVHPTVLVRAARTWAAKGKRPLDRPLHPGFSLRAAADLAELTPAGRQVMYRRARAAVLARTRGHYPAPLKALEAIEAGFEHGMAAGLEAEAHAFGELASNAAARHLIWLFMASQRQRRATIGGAPVSKTERVGVVGAGFMGAAIAEVAAATGATVRVRDMQPEAVASGLSRIRKMVDAGRTRRRFDASEARDIVQRISGTTDYAGFRNVDVVVEAVFEDLGAKQAVVAELERTIRPEAVIASNTSALPIREIATRAEHPERIVGMHFFSPAERMPLLEVVRPAAASESAIARAVELGTRMGKTVIVVGDAPGFYTSRVLGVMLNEAALLLGEGARIEAIDHALTAFGFPVGPFVLYDEVGLEVALHAGETVARAFGDRIPPAPIVPRLVAAGETGRKAGVGFYVWPKASRVRRLLTRLARRPARAVNPAIYGMAGGTIPRPFAEREIQDRLVLLFVNEAIRCLEEGVLRSATDGDLGAVLGLGFPPFTGGPFHYADERGLAEVETRLRKLGAQHGPRYAPAALLVERAREGRTFFED